MTEHVALLHADRVLIDASGSLPVLPPQDAPAEERPLAEILALVGADIPLAPTARLADGRYVHFVGVRAAASPGTLVAPGELQDAVLARAVAHAVAERDPASTAASTPAARPDWFRPGWFDRIEAWIDAVLEPTGRRRTGPVDPFRLWSISAVVRVPTDAGVLWCKAPCAFFRAEARIHTSVARLFPELVPVLVAAHEAEGWVLMQPMAGAEETERPDGSALRVARRWAAAQRAAITHVPTLLAAGLTHRDAETTIVAFDRVLTASTELALLTDDALAAARAAAEPAAALVREFWAAGIPDTLAHGDLHPGNVAWDGTTLRIFDWTDGCVSHPFLDASHLVRSVDDAAAAAVQTAYADGWRTAFPHVDVDRVIALAPLANLLFQTVTFDEIAKATEPQSAWELEGVVARNLRQLPAMVAELGR